MEICIGLLLVAFVFAFYARYRMSQARIAFWRAVLLDVLSQHPE